MRVGYDEPMMPVIVKVEIDHGKITALEPDKLPAHGSGILTISAETAPVSPKNRGRRVTFPLIRGSGERLIDPQPEDLDSSLWNK
jgi:hypothetical protein